MKTSVFVLITTATLVASFHCTEQQERTEPQKKTDIFQGTMEGLYIDNIMTTPLALAEGVETVVSRVRIPPDTTLPRHWHPGEEYVYVLQGSVTIWQKDKPDTVLSKGNAFKVSLKQVHTAITGKEGVEVLVFRVHEAGQPVRVIVE